jgi:hypothetical protein
LAPDEAVEELPSADPAPLAMANQGC